VTKSAYFMSILFFLPLLNLCAKTYAQVDYSIGGTTSDHNLPITLLLNSTEGSSWLQVSEPGEFVFPIRLPAGTAYDIGVLTNTNGNEGRCSIVNSSGIVSQDVDDITVSCGVSRRFYTIGGNVSGLSGTLVLKNYSDTLVVFQNGIFSFNELLESGSNYDITIATQPDNQSCLVSGGSGVATDNITSVDVTCSERVQLSVSGGLKSLDFSWSAVNSATHYRLYENSDGASGFNLIDEFPITQTDYSLSIAVHLTNWSDARYLVEACDTSSCTASADIGINEVMLDTIGYFKAAVDNDPHEFGASVSLSEDGNTLAVGSPLERDGGDPASPPGKVYIYHNDGTQWNRQAVIDTEYQDVFDEFGHSVNLSADGNTLAVGAIGEDSNATGVNGDQSDNGSSDSGAVFVFVRDGESWNQQAYIKGSSADDIHQFGSAVALSADGGILAASSSSSVFLYGRTGTQWSQWDFLRPVNFSFDDQFGRSLSLSHDGDTLAVGAYLEDGENDDYEDAGAVYIFSRTGSPSWLQQAIIRAENPINHARFGWSISLSAGAITLAVGSNYGPAEGQAYVFNWNGNSWTQQAIFAPGFGPDDNQFFGESISLSSDGKLLAVGSKYEASSARGIGGDQSDESSPGAGAVYVYRRTGDSWGPEIFVKPSNTETEAGLTFDQFGFSVDVSGDGSTLAVGAPTEDSDARGIGGDQHNNDEPNAGAVYVY